MKEKKEKMGKKIYKDNLESIVVSIPYDLMVWVRENGSFSDMVREILDRKTGDEPELNTPLKKQKRPTRGRPRKDEDLNYVPPIKRPRGRPKKNPMENLSKSDTEKD